MKNNNQTRAYDLTLGEFDWQIAPGRTIRAWGFNGQVPGPTLTATVGDTMVIRVKNELPEATVIHWHGLRLPANMDGTAVVQNPIQPGETFEYRYQVTDAGTFWYHSHANETVQVERGIYGALIVSEETELRTDGEQVFLFDDMKLTPDDSFTRPDGYFSRMKERHDGRQGDTLLLNGKVNPEIQIAAGQQERWRFINASSARYVYLTLDGKPFQLIATDGGLLEQPRTETTVLLTPGERIEILAGPFEEGERFSISSLPYNRMTFLKPRQESFGTVAVGERKPSKARLPETLRVIEPLAPKEAKANRTIRFSVGPSLRHGMNFLVNGKVHVDDKPVQVGALQVWEVNNASLMDHPFHLHGEFFQVLSVNGEAPAFRAWKDTVNLPPRTKVKIAWTPERTGMWMYHCHILEHHEAGMMANFEVVDGHQSPEEYSGAMAAHALHKH